MSPVGMKKSSGGRKDEVGHGSNHENEAGCDSNHTQPPPSAPPSPPPSLRFENRTKATMGNMGGEAIGNPNQGVEAFRNLKIKTPSLLSKCANQPLPPPSYPPEELSDAGRGNPVTPAISAEFRIRVERKEAAKPATNPLSKLLSLTAAPPLPPPPLPPSSSLMPPYPPPPQLLGFETRSGGKRGSIPNQEESNKKFQKLNMSFLDVTNSDGRIPVPDQSSRIGDDRCVTISHIGMVTEGQQSMVEMTAPLRVKEEN